MDGGPWWGSCPPALEGRCPSSCGHLRLQKHIQTRWGWRWTKAPPSYPGLLCLRYSPGEKERRKITLGTLRTITPEEESTVKYVWKKMLSIGGIAIWGGGHRLHFTYPIAWCGQGVIEAAERGNSIQLSDGDQLLTVSLLKVQCALHILIKQTL